VTLGPHTHPHTPCPAPPLPSESSLLLSQFTEEKFGQAEKTELDAHFENLLARADSTKNWTEKILRQTEVLLQPNPSECPGRGEGRGWTFLTCPGPRAGGLQDAL
jgi:hypothetical protein